MVKIKPDYIECPECYKISDKRKKGKKCSHCDVNLIYFGETLSSNDGYIYNHTFWEPLSIFSEREEKLKEQRHLNFIEWFKTQLQWDMEINDIEEDEKTCKLRKFKDVSSLIKHIKDKHGPNEEAIEFFGKRHEDYLNYLEKLYKMDYKKMTANWIRNTTVRADKVRAELNNLKALDSDKYPNLMKLLDQIDKIIE